MKLISPRFPLEGGGLFRTPFMFIFGSLQKIKALFRSDRFKKKEFELLKGFQNIYSFVEFPSRRWGSFSLPCIITYLSLHNIRERKGNFEFLLRLEPHDITLRAWLQCHFARTLLRVQLVEQTSFTFQLTQPFPCIILMLILIFYC